MSCSDLSVICLTPVKNEEWILDRFLQCASLWADQIVVADQNSTDDSREIARSYDKVYLIENPSDEFNEPERQKLLIETARDLVSPPRLLITLDADEILTANVLASQEWESVKTADPGTVIEFSRIELIHSPSTYFEHSVRDNQTRFQFGYVDDGADHVGSKIHSPRVPIPDGAPRLQLSDVSVLHYQFCDWDRMLSKHRWYRCYERLEFPDRSAVDINQQYSWMHRRSVDVRPCPSHWLDAYQKRDIDMTTIKTADSFWWDWEVLAWFAEHGLEPFQSLDIWNIDWERLRQIGLEQGRDKLPDFPIESPQSLHHRIGLKLLREPDWLRSHRLSRSIARLLL